MKTAVSHLSTKHYVHAYCFPPIFIHPYVYAHCCSPLHETLFPLYFIEHYIHVYCRSQFLYNAMYMRTVVPQSFNKPYVHAFCCSPPPSYYTLTTYIVVAHSILLNSSAIPMKNTSLTLHSNLYQNQLRTLFFRPNPNLLRPNKIL